MKNFFPSHSSPLFPLYILHILNDGFNASLILLLPFIAMDLQLNLTQVGLLGTLINALGIFIALPAGYIATKFGGLKTLLFALVLYGLAFLGTGFSQNFVSLFPLFILASIGFGLFHPIAFALVSRFSDKETRGREMGNFTAIGDVGRVGIAAVLTFIVVYIGWQNTAIVYASVALLIGLISYFAYLKKTDYFSSKDKKSSSSKISDVIKNQRFLLVTSAAFFDTFVNGSVFIFLPFLVLARGVDPAFIGTYAAAFFIGTFVGKTLLGRMVDRFGNKQVFIFSEIVMALLILILANATSFLIILICALIIGVFAKGTVPVLQTMVADSVKHGETMEKAFGINQIAGNTAMAISPLIFGYVANVYGIVTAFNMLALVVLFAIIPVLILLKKTAT
ncbi:MAG: MFS transporter [Candidatus Levybacteria bacterium]|nr:MFS transporter [Candidatus Levybacteria bacterium]